MIKQEDQQDTMNSQPNSSKFTNNGNNNNNNSSNQWPLTANQYEQHVLIGKGTFSSVWSGSCKTMTNNHTTTSTNPGNNNNNSSNKICIKIMDLDNLNISNLDEILTELSMLRLCDDKDSNILTNYINFVYKEQLWLITQFMDKGSALRVLTLSRAMTLVDGQGGFNEDCIAYILSEVLKGINYLHSRSLIHRNIKAANILLDSSGSVKLSDLAFSGMTMEIGQRTGNKAKTLVGTPYYIAPEVFESNHSNKAEGSEGIGGTVGGGGGSEGGNGSGKGGNNEGYDNRADIWSLGITILELAKGSPPYCCNNNNHTPNHHYNILSIIKLTLNNDPPSLKNYHHDRQCHQEGPSFSKTFEDFYKKCLQKNPKYRPSASELLKHRLIRNSSAESLIQYLKFIPNIDCPVDYDNNNNNNNNNSLNSKSNSHNHHMEYHQQLQAINEEIFSEIESHSLESQLQVQLQSQQRPSQLPTEDTSSTKTVVPSLNDLNNNDSSNGSSSSKKTTTSSSSSDELTVVTGFQSLTTTVDNTPFADSEPTPSSIQDDPLRVIPPTACDNNDGREGEEEQDNSSKSDTNNSQKTKNQQQLIYFDHSPLMDHHQQEGESSGHSSNHNNRSRTNSIPFHTSSSSSSSSSECNTNSEPSSGKYSKEDGDKRDKEEPTTTTSTSSSSYVPGTTWIFDVNELKTLQASVLSPTTETTENEEGEGEKEETRQEEEQEDKQLHNKMESMTINLINADNGKDDDLEDFLEEFELNEATLRN